MSKGRVGYLALASALILGVMLPATAAAQDGTRPRTRGEATTGRAAPRDGGGYYGRDEGYYGRDGGYEGRDGGYSERDDDYYDYGPDGDYYPVYRPQDRRRSVRGDSAGERDRDYREWEKARRESEREWAKAEREVWKERAKAEREAWKEDMKDGREWERERAKDEREREKEWQKARKEGRKR